MSTPARRLAQLEAQSSPAREADPVAAWTFELCQGSALLAAIRHAGMTRARRRHLSDSPADPLYFDPPTLRTEGLRAEYAVLRALTAEADGDGFDLIQIIEAWIAEPAALGWPRPKSGADRVLSDVEAFHLTWRAQHQTIENNRSGRGGVTWRAANPDWRPDMPDDEHYAWDIDRISAAIERGDF